MKKMKFHLSSIRMKKSYFVKMLIFYSVFTVSIILFCLYISMNLFGKSLENEIQESNKRLLTQIQIYIDKNLIEKINSITNEKFLDVSSDSVLLDFYKFQNPKESSLLLAINNSLSNILVNCEYISSVALFRKSDDTYMSTNTGVKFNYTANDKDFSNFHTNIVEKFTSTHKNKLWISPSENKAMYGDTPTITYVQTIPLYSTYEKSNGYIVFNINHNLLFQPINKIYGQAGDLLVIDQEGKIFGHSNSSSLNEELSRDGYLRTVLSEDEGFISTVVNSKNCGITWIKSASNDWKYVSIVPMEALNQQASAVRNIILVIFGCLLLVSFVALNIITSRLYSPLKALTQKVKDNYSLEDKEENELNYINNALTYLSSKVDDMEDTLKNNQEVIKYKTVIDILYGHTSSPEEIQSRMDLLNTSCHHESYAIVIVEIDQQVFSIISTGQKEYITSRATELTNFFFSNKCNCITICHPSNCIAAILNFNGESLESLSFNSLLKYLQEELEVFFNVAISRTCKNASLLDSIYSETRDYLKYSYIYGYNNVFTHTLVEKYEATGSELDYANILLQLESSIKTGKLDKLAELLNQQVTSIKTNGYSYNYTQNFLLQVVSMLSKLCREQGITSGQLEKSKIISDFNSIASLGECINWIISIAYIYQENVNVRNSTIDHEFTQRIADYITENIEKQLSLNSVANDFNITPSYLSRLFKEDLNINFSDFIYNKKLEKAADLIINDRDKNIVEIAEKLGYYTPSYFAKIFKVKYGMTPALYRKKYLTEHKK